MRGKKEKAERLGEGESAGAVRVINTFSDKWHECEAQMEHLEETPKHTYKHAGQVPGHMLKLFVLHSSYLCSSKRPVREHRPFQWLEAVTYTHTSGHIAKSVNTSYTYNTVYEGRCKSARGIESQRGSWFCQHFCDPMLRGEERRKEEKTISTWEAKYNAAYACLRAVEERLITVKLPLFFTLLTQRNSVSTTAGFTFNFTAELSHVL